MKRKVVSLIFRFGLCLIFAALQIVIAPGPSAAIALTTEQGGFALRSVVEQGANTENGAFNHPRIDQRVADNILFYDDFESGVLDSRWSVEVTNDGRARVSDAYSHEGSYSLLLDDSVEDRTESNVAVILALDLRSQREVDFDFWWREFDDENDPQDGVFLSDDGGVTWHEVWSFNGDFYAEWQHALVDIDTEAELNGLVLNDNFQIKIQFRDNTPIDTDGYAIDEVTVRATPPAQPATPPFYDGFETGALGASWVADTTRNGRVRVSDLYPYTGSYSLLLDGSADQANSLAMATLALDLSTQDQVELDFWWREFNDEDDPEDGVFLSDDGGASWHLALSFNGSHDETWHQATIDLDDAAAAAGLSLNDRFQIRFQFYDDAQIDSDGYGIDEVRIRPIEATGFPYYEDFENGSLGAAWSLYTTDEGRTQVRPSHAYSGTYSLQLDSSGSRGKSYAAAILNIDLSAQSQVMLDLTWREFDDEDDPEDGVFISDDEGTTWHPALSFGGDHGSSWQQTNLNLSSVAHQAGLALNDRFQIKFQFYDNSPIDKDGYAIDNIRVRQNANPTLTWPGDAGYESDGLDPESGHTQTTFVYRVAYADADGDPPGSVMVHVNKGDAPLADSPFEMNCASGHYVEPVVCSKNQQGLDAGTDYIYWFTAVDDQGNSALATAEFDAPDVAVHYWVYAPQVMKDAGPPAGPPVLDAIDNPNGDYRFTVAWHAVEGATHYQLQEDSDPAFPSPVSAYSGANTSTELTVGDVGTYYYRVRASIDFGVSAWSDTQSTQVTVSPPPCPRTGSWEGLTEYDRSIRFTVSNTPRCQIEDLRISYVICASATTTLFYDTYPIVNDHFEAQGNLGWVKGDFATDTLAMGDYQFEMMCPGNPPIPDIVWGNWTANK